MHIEQILCVSWYMTNLYNSILKKDITKTSHVMKMIEYIYIYILLIHVFAFLWKIRICGVYKICLMICKKKKASLYILSL